MTVSAVCAPNKFPSHRVITDSYEYDAFGNSFTVSGSTPNNDLYRGEQFDSDLGLYYLRARYYNPLTGRFMSRDPEDRRPVDSDGLPIDPQSLHKYLYAAGDPVNRFDPTGRIDLIQYAIKVGRLAVAFPWTAAAITACGTATWVGIADVLDSADGSPMTRKDWAAIGGAYATCVVSWLGALAEAGS